MTVRHVFLRIFSPGLLPLLLLILQKFQLKSLYKNVQTESTYHQNVFLWNLKPERLIIIEKLSFLNFSCFGIVLFAADLCIWGADHSCCHCSTAAGIEELWNNMSSSHNFVISVVLIVWWIKLIYLMFLNCFTK